MMLARPLVRLAALASAALVPAPLAAQSVFVVDADGGAAFTEIQDAIDAAVSGDVIVVREGTYREFTLAGKGLTIVADEYGKARVGVSRQITTAVTGIAAGNRAVIRGIVFTSPLQTTGASLHVADNAGVVWFESVSFDQLTPFHSHSQLEAVLVEDCAQVVIVGSALQGASGSSLGGLEIGATGLTARDSMVLLHGCTVRAGYSIVLSGTGSPGLAVDGGELVLRNCTVRGGVGGTGSPGGVGGDGGPGLTIEGNASVWAIGTSLIGGAGGPTVFGSPGATGAGFEVTAGSLQQIPAGLALFATDLVAGSGEDLEFELVGPPRSSAWLLVSLTSVPVFVPGLPGFLGTGLAPAVVAVGSTDSVGALSFTIPGSPLPPGLATWDATVQMAIAAPGGVLELSNPSILTVVDDAVR